MWPHTHRQTSSAVHCSLCEGLVPRRPAHRVPVPPPQTRDPPPWGTALATTTTLSLQGAMRFQEQEKGSPPSPGVCTASDLETEIVYIACQQTLGGQICCM